MEKVIAGQTIHLNEEGYLKDFNQWNKEIGHELAKEADIDLGSRHWQVIDYLQKEHKNQSPISIRRIAKSNVIDVGELYQLFPRGPLKTASKIAGIPKPASCI